MVLAGLATGHGTTQFKCNTQCQDADVQEQFVVPLTLGVVESLCSARHSSPVNETLIIDLLSDDFLQS